MSKELLLHVSSFSSNKISTRKHAMHLEWDLTWFYTVCSDISVGTCQNDDALTGLRRRDVAALLKHHHSDVCLVGSFSIFRVTELTKLPHTKRQENDI